MNISAELGGLSMEIGLALDRQESSTRIFGESMVELEETGQATSRSSSELTEMAERLKAQSEAFARIVGRLRSTERPST